MPESRERQQMKKHPFFAPMNPRHDSENEAVVPSTDVQLRDRGEGTNEPAEALLVIAPVVLCMRPHGATLCALALATEAILALLCAFLFLLFIAADVEPPKFDASRDTLVVGSLAVLMGSSYGAAVVAMLLFDNRLVVFVEARARRSRSDCCHWQRSCSWKCAHRG
jgi:hypothetical protein